MREHELILHNGHVLTLDAASRTDGGDRGLGGASSPGSVPPPKCSLATATRRG